MPYALLCAAINVYFISRIWAVEEAGTIERMVNVGVATLLYGLPGLYRGEVEGFLYGVFFFILGAIAMYLRLRGWGHSIMHLCLGGLTHQVVVSVSGLQR